MIKYAVIGTSWITQSFIDGSRLDGDMQLAAVYSRSAEKGADFAKANGVDRVYTDINDLAAAKDIDACYVASPNAFHAGQTEILLSAGKHVICEKPITVEPEELEKLQKIAAEKGVIYIEAIMHMFNPARRILADALSQIGIITGAHFDFSQLSSKYPALKSGQLPNIFNPAMATGCLMDLGIYCVYPAIDYFGVPERIEATASFLATGADAQGSATFFYNDKQVNMTYSKIGQDRCGSQFFGDEGTAVVGSISKLTDISIVKNDGSRIALVGDVPKERLMANEAAAMSRFINNPVETAEEYKNAAKNALLVSRAMKTIREKAGIKFGEKI